MEMLSADVTTRFECCELQLKESCNVIMQLSGGVLFKYQYTVLFAAL